jgi:hypothetical protein
MPGARVNEEISSSNNRANNKNFDFFLTDALSARSLEGAVKLSIWPPHLLGIMAGEPDAGFTGKENFSCAYSATDHKWHGSC